MDPSTPRDPPDDPRTGFLRTLPRKVVEVKATFGALIADPRSTRMRDELRRKLHTLYTLARSYQVPRLADELRACVDILDATKSLPALARAHIDTLASHIAGLTSVAEQDNNAPEAPNGTRQDSTRVPTTRMSVPNLTRPASKITLPPDYAMPSAPPEQRRASPVPYRTLPPGTTLRKNLSLGGAHAAAMHVLFVGSSARANSLHEAVPAEVELLVTRSADDAAQRARDAGPDVIVAEVAGMADGVALLQALRSDPLTEFFPVVLVAPQGETVDTVRERCPEALDVVPDSADGAALWEALERHLSSGAAVTSAHDFGDLTLDELTRALQDELRRGIVGAASPRARGQRIHMGAGNEVLAATWEAIARIREVVERRSNGSVRFELPAAPRGLPGTQIFSLGNDEATAPPPEAPGDDPLPGRRVLVVDDDPAVLATFRALLKDARADVNECHDGTQALLLARRMRPDLVIADIVMPGLDGFALCRHIRRDPALRHTPVILLSWKDDLLVRMRELGAQAQGYLRKEAGGDAILTRVRDALRMRTRLLRRVSELPEGVEVRGRLERVGVFPLLETTASALGDGTVTVSDPSSVTELHVRGARLVSVLRTAHDGSLVRGEAALRLVLGVSSARFVVVRSKAHVRENLVGALDELLTRSARAIVALEEALAGSALLEVVAVDLDRDTAQTYARTLPGRLRTLVERVVDGESPRDLVLREGMAPSDLEPLLVELARRGAIRKVLGVDGVDLAARRAAALDVVQLPAPEERVVPMPAPRPPAEEEGGDTLADAVFRELRDSVADDPRKRKLSPGPLPAARPVIIVTPPEQPRAQPPVEEVALVLEPVPLPVDDLPPLEIEENFDAIKTPSAPVSAKLLAASKASGTDETRKVKAVVLDERGEVAREVTASEKPPPGERFAADVAAEKAPTRRLEAVRAVPPEALASPRPSARAVPLADDAQTLELAYNDVMEALQKADPEAVRPTTPAMGPESPTGTLQGTPPPPPQTRPPAPPPAAPATASTAPTRPRASAPPQPAAPERTRTRPPPPPAPTPAPAVTVSRAAASTASTAPSPARAPSTTTHAAARQESWSMRPALLLLGVGAAFTASYYGVRWYLSRQPAGVDAVQVEVPTDDAEAPGLPTPEPAIPRDAPSAAEAALHADATPAALDASAPQAPTGALVPPRATVSDGDYRAPDAWLDGGALAPRTGLLVLTSAAPVAVQIDQHDVGTTPLQLAQPEGLRSLRVRNGTGWSYRLVTVRAGQALVMEVPQGR